MRGLLGFIGVSLGGAIGWWLGEQIGLFTAVVLSAIGSGAGLYYARRLLDSLL
jgi:hypothetical protein